MPFSLFDTTQPVEVWKVAGDARVSERSDCFGCLSANRYFGRARDLSCCHTSPNGLTSVSRALPNQTGFAQSVLSCAKTILEKLASWRWVAARMILVNAATSSIDAHYYIWRNDLTRSLLPDDLERAANRGVRVGMWMDDNGTSGFGAQFAALNAHEDAQVQRYNPFNLRRLKSQPSAFDVFWLDRRAQHRGRVF